MPQKEGAMSKEPEEDKFSKLIAELTPENLLEVLRYINFLLSLQALERAGRADATPMLEPSRTQPTA